MQAGVILEGESSLEHQHAYRKAYSMYFYVAWYERAHFTVSGATPKLLVLGAIKN